MTSRSPSACSVLGSTADTCSSQSTEAVFWFNGPCTWQPLVRCWCLPEGHWNADILGDDSRSVSAALPWFDSGYMSVHGLLYLAASCSLLVCLRSTARTFWEVTPGLFPHSALPWLVFVVVRGQAQDFQHFGRRGCGRASRRPRQWHVHQVWIRFVAHFALWERLRWYSSHRLHGVCVHFRADSAASNSLSVSVQGRAFKRRFLRGRGSVWCSPWLRRASLRRT